MKLLFTHSYFMRFDPKQWTTGNPYAPLGTLYASAYLRKQGHEIAFFDTMFSRSPEEIIPLIEKAIPDIFVIYDDGFNYLTKMCLGNMRQAAFEMIKFAKDRECIVVVSSSDSTDRFEMYLNEGADFILLGEAEQTLLELTELIKRGEADYMSVEGLAFRQRDVVVKTKKRNVLKNLDSLPFPAWDLVNMEPYRAMWLKHAGYFSMNMGTTRGCPFKCNWCAKPIYGNRYHSRSPQNVVNELKWLKQTYAFDHIWFCDDIFGLTPGWIKEFANLVEKEKLRFAFKMQGRVDLLLKEDNVRDLKKAGCANIWMGAESGSQKILDAMDKGTTVEQIYQATRLLKTNGIKPSFFIQFGYPGENRNDIEKTIHMINDLLPAEIGISVSYPLPGTVFYNTVNSQLKNKTNWTDSDELALMFKNTYQPAFYKQLHRFVHKTYRKNMAYDYLKEIIKNPLDSNYLKIKKAISAVYYLPASVIEGIKLRQLEKPVHE